MNRTLTADHGFSSALVVTVTDNVSKRLELELSEILNSINAVLPTEALIVTSSQKSRVVDALESPLESGSKVHYLTAIDDTLSGSDDSKSRKLRNMYVHAIREDPVFAKSELIVVVDLDGSNRSITESSFRSALGSAFQWDALAANKLGKYRDIESLRHKHWSPNNCMSDFMWLKSFLKENQAWERAVKSKMLRIPTHVSPISVDSAFGGLCIYKRWIFEQCDYNYDGEHMQSENSHVTLNRKAKGNGARVFIHPELINSKRRHLHFLQKEFIRQLKLRSHAFPFIFLLPLLRRLRYTLQKP
jgi:hypothetical protein